MTERRREMEKEKKKKSGTVTPVSKWVQAGIEIRQDKRSTSLDDTVIVPPYLSRRYFIVKQKQKNWIETSQQQCYCSIGFKETPHQYLRFLLYSRQSIIDIRIFVCPLMNKANSFVFPCYTNWIKDEVTYYLAGDGGARLAQSPQWANHAAGSFLVGWISGVAAVSRNKQKTNQGKGRRKGRRGWWLTSTLLAAAE